MRSETQARYLPDESGYKKDSGVYLGPLRVWNEWDGLVGLLALIAQLFGPLANCCQELGR